MVRDRRLRWSMADGIERELAGQGVLGLTRRSKYQLARVDTGHLVIRLGTSGNLRITGEDEPASIHDPIDLVTAADPLVRYRDPRRFGRFLWTTEPLQHHQLLKDLGPESLAREFDGNLLFNAGCGRRVAVKNLIMDANVVVGVGNIYANENQAGRPGRQWKRVDSASLEISPKELNKAAFFGITVVRSISYRVRRRRPYEDRVYAESIGISRFWKARGSGSI